MTEAFSKTTYGLLSKTILGKLANESVSVEKTFTFSLYLQWGVIIAYPTGRSRKALVLDVLSWINQNEPEPFKNRNPEGLKKMFNVNKQVFFEIFEHITTVPVPEKYKWYKAWEEHCSDYLSRHTSSADCCLLLEIVQHSMELKFEELFIGINLLNEVLDHYEPTFTVTR
jgi:hypothetical protein